MDYLYAGTILRVDLTKEKITREPTAPYARQFIGGRGVDVRILYGETGPETKPLDPENVLLFGTGPLTGTLFPGTSRTDVMSKSPVTNILGNSNFGGIWAAELKYAGYDHLVLKGKAKKPVYIHIDNEEIEIRDASHLWGKDTYETQRLIREELADPEVKVVCVGPAGENSVVYATVQSSVGDAASRTGMGAVMGSKNLKAIAVRGTKGVKLADPEKFLEVCKEATDLIKSTIWYQLLPASGVADTEYTYVLSGWEMSGDEHKSAPNFDAAGKTDYGKFYEKYLYKKRGCFSCPIQCMDNYRVPGLGATVLSCELYTQLNWGVRNDDMLLWYKATLLCQKAGIDAVSVARVFAWLMLLYEMGIITAKETDGIAMEWGSQDAIFGMLDKTISREGFGKVIADGIDAIAQKLDAAVPSTKRHGKSTKYWAMQVKNNPMCGINPRYKANALSYAIGRRGDLIQDLDTVTENKIITEGLDPRLSEEERHEAMEDSYKNAFELTGTRDAADPEKYEGKGILVAKLGDDITIADLVCSCKWHTVWLVDAIGPEIQAKALSAGLGRDVSVDELVQAAHRVRTLERAYDAREGKTRAHDTLPEKEFGRAVSRGWLKGATLERNKFEQMKDEYYAIRGWDVKTGIPTEETLKKYDLGDVAQDLKKRGILPASAKAV